MAKSRTNLSRRARTGGGRAAFLSEACRGDENLRREVESLLAEDDAGASFLESPALEIEARRVAENSENSALDLPEKNDSPISQKRHPFFWFTLAAGAVTFAFYVFAIFLIARYGAAEGNFGWTATRQNGEFFISQIEADSPAADVLRTGDKLISINGDGRVNRLGANYKLYQITRDNPYLIRVERAGVGEREFSLRVGERTNAANWAVTLSWFAATVPWFVTAVLVGLFQPANRAGQLYCLFAFMMTLIWLNGASVTFRSLLQPAEL